MSATLQRAKGTQLDTWGSGELDPYINETYRHSELAGLTHISRVEPLEQFRKQVYDSWLPKCGESVDGISWKTWFENAEHDGAVQLKQYAASELRDLRDLDKIHWKEQCHYEDVLRKIQMPIDPARSFSGRGEGPVLFVKDADRGVVIVVNGNHRAGAVMLEKYNPTNSSLYVVEFSSIEAYEKFAETPLTKRSYLDIQVEPGPRRQF